LIGEALLGGRDFQYAGSIGPLDLTASQRQQWQQLGDCLSDRFGLRGLFGVDAIDTGRAIIPVEINPRYTASIEVLERSLRWPIAAWHVQACRTARLPELPSAKAIGCCGKAIVYAEHRCRWTGEKAALRMADTAAGGWPSLADIPRQGTRFECGWPILTVLAQGSGLADVNHRLLERAAQVRTDWLSSV
jgi:predicted ATP-grasp superfamily ATP-dependent carboligase